MTSVVKSFLKLIDNLRKLIKPGLTFDPFGSADCALSKADARFCVVGEEDCVIG